MTRTPARRSTALRRPEPLSVQIADELRRDILFGRLTEDDRISQESLSQQFDTSRMPIRDAVLQLVREGYLTRGRGDVISVVPVDMDDITVMFHIEGMLVGYAARLACERATDEEIEALWALHRKMEAEVAAQDFEVAAQTNRNLHEGINRAGRSHRLVATIRHVSMRLHREFLIEFPEWITHSLTDHEAILAAISNRDGTAAERIMVAHVGASGEEVARMLAENLEAHRAERATAGEAT